MLRLQRAWSLGGASLSQRELRFGEGVVLLQEHDGFLFHEVPRPTVGGWSRVFVVLRGGALVGQRWVLPGGVVRDPGWGGQPCLDASPDLRLLMLAWRDQDAREGATWCLGPMARARLEQIADRLLEASPHDVLELGLLLLGRSELPGDQLRRGLQAPEDEALRRLAGGICGLSSRLDQSPTGVDLVSALGGDERALSALAISYFRRYHATVSGWRDYLFWLRIELGITALRSGFGVAEVSRWLGFRSSSAFCHAFRQAGLEPPGAWRRHGERHGALHPPGLLYQEPP